MAKSKYNKKFEKDISFFINKTNTNITKVKALAIYDLFSNVVDDTPLYIKGYSGRGNVKYNWTISVGTLNPKYLMGTDVGGSRTKERGYAQLMKLTDGSVETVYIHNSHPAILKLEYGGYPTPSKTGRTSGGFSTQAPQGILRVNALQWNVYVPSAVKTVN